MRRVAVSPCLAKPVKSAVSITARPRQAIREHAADQEEGDERRCPRRDHVAEIRGVFGEPEDRERERDRRHRIAELRHDLAGVGQAEIPLVENN